MALRRLAIIFGLVMAGFLTAPITPAPERHGTWSLVAVDAKSGDVGVALASCVTSTAMVIRLANGYRIGAREGGRPNVDLAHLVPGRGAIVAQGDVDVHGAARLDQAAAILRSGGTAEQAIAAAREGDAGDARRQYGAVTLAPSANAFTGADTPYVSGQVTRPYLSVQGNTLAADDVLQSARASFEASSGPLADALLEGLRAGAAAGGDQRCPRQAATVAFLAVAAANDSAPQPRVWSQAAVPKGGQPVVEVLEHSYRTRAPANIDSPPGSETKVLALAAALALAGALLGSMIVWRARRDRRSRRAQPGSIDANTPPT